MKKLFVFFLLLFVVGGYSQSITFDKVVVPIESTAKNLTPKQINKIALEAVGTTKSKLKYPNTFIPIKVSINDDNGVTAEVIYQSQNVYKKTKTSQLTFYFDQSLYLIRNRMGIKLIK